MAIEGVLARQKFAAKWCATLWPPGIQFSVSPDSQISLPEQSRSIEQCTHTHTLKHKHDDRKNMKEQQHMNNHKLATPIQTISIRSIPNIPELNVII